MSSQLRGSAGVPGHPLAGLLRFVDPLEVAPSLVPRLILSAEGLGLLRRHAVRSIEVRLSDDDSSSTTVVLLRPGPIEPSPKGLLDEPPRQDPSQ